MTWLSASHADEMLYGAVVSAAVLAVVSTHAEAAWQLMAATTGTLLVYWAAHVYTQAFADALAGPASSWWARVVSAAVEELAILRGGAPTLVAFGVATVFGAGIPLATDIAVWVTVLLLAGVGYLAGHAAGAGAWGKVLWVLAAAAFGVVAALLKAALH